MIERLPTLSATIRSIPPTIQPPPPKQAIKAAPILVPPRHKHSKDDKRGYWPHDIVRKMKETDNARAKKTEPHILKRGETHSVKDKWTDPAPSFTSSNIWQRQTFGYGRGGVEQSQVTRLDCLQK